MPLEAEPIRNALLERRAALAQEIEEVDEALRAIDSALEKAARIIGGAHTVVAMPIVTKPEKAPNAPPRTAIDDSAKEPQTEIVNIFLTSKEANDTFTAVSLTPEIAEVGLTSTPLTQVQVSLALRGLLNQGKIELVERGGPRKPAIYALPGYKTRMSNDGVEKGGRAMGGAVGS